MLWGGAQPPVLGQWSRPHWGESGHIAQVPRAAAASGLMHPSLVWGPVRVAGQSDSSPCVLNQHVAFPHDDLACYISVQTSTILPQEQRTVSQEIHPED